MSVTGERLKKLRLSRHMSQADVAKLIGVERVTYLQYEKGTNKPVRKLKELANLFNVSIDYLLGNSDAFPVTENYDLGINVVKSRPLDEKQTELINGYDELNDDGRLLLFGMLNSLRQSHARVATN